MKRDMDLVRKIMLKIEEDFESTALFNIKIEEYSFEQIAMHCKMLYEAGLISSCNVGYGSDSVYVFSVGNLTWAGYEYLDLVRDESTWKKVKDTAKNQGIPLMLDTVKQISSAIITSVTEGAIKALMNS